MAQNTELTRITVGRDARTQQSPAERLLRTLQSSLAGQFELFGELGRGDGGRIVFLAREVASGRLVALQLTPTGAKTIGGEDYWFEIARTLDASIPAPDSDCPSCGKSLGGWSRFCRHCGVDLSGVAAGGSTSPDDLLRDVRAVAAGRYTILGQMDRSEGGGTVYFAREIATGRLVALRLQRERDGAHGTERFSIGLTGVLRPAMAAALNIAPEPAKAPAASKETAAANAATVVARPPVQPPRLTPEPTAAPVAPTRPVAAADVAPVAPTRPVLQPRTPPWRPTRDQVIAIGTAAAVIVALVWYAATRNNDDGDAMILGDAALVDSTAPIASSLLQADSGSVEIGVELPRGAVLEVDGKKVTGSDLRVPVGDHTFSLKAPGYREATQQVTVKNGQQLMWTPQMIRLSEAGGNVATRRQPAPRPDPPPARSSAPPRRAATTTARTPVIDSTPPVSVSATTRTDSTPALTDLSPVSCGSLFARLEWARALATCEDEAKRGSSVAQRTVGTIQERGLGVTPNPRKAAEYYAKAAEAGDAIAQFRLGALMFSGTGVRKDEKQALVWIRRAADQQHLDAMYALGQSLERGEGTKKNPSEALALFTRTADLGYPRAQTKLGSLYAAGDIVPRDNRLAVTWFRKAADQGYAEAQYRLGDMYARGLGVAKSDVEARRWFQRAAAQGHERARKALR